MNHLITLLNSEFCGNIVLALLHTLWQAVIIAVLLYIFLRSKTGKEASKRYMASIVALAAIVLCGLFTWAVLNYEPLSIQQYGDSDPIRNQTAEITSNSEESNKVVSITQTQNHKKQSSRTFDSATWHVWIMCLWMIGVIIMLCRTVHLVIGAERLRRQCQRLENKSVLELIEQLRQSMRIARKIRVAVSERISVPGVIGFIWPTLLLPTSMISGIPMDDLKAILSHELAHIRRYDYLINFCQMIIEAVLFFNPALWWVSRQIRIEREVCCDSAGIAITGQRIKYAQVLTDWAQKLRGQDTDKLAAAITGFGNANQSGSMLDRVKRIVVTGHRPRVRASWYVTAEMLLLSAAVLLGVGSGMNITVAFAAELLTPQERIEKIEQLAKEHGFEDREYTDEDKIEISGTVYTYDGQPLPSNARIMVRSERPRHSFNSGIQIQIDGGIQVPFAENGVFKYRAEYGRIWLVASVNGYAPTFAGPFEAEPGGSISDIEIVLEQGFQGQIKIVDSDGEPVEGANLKGGYVYSGNSFHYTIGLVSDSMGNATIEHASSQNITLHVQANGFEHDTFKGIGLKPDEIVELQLKQAQITSGVVLSKQTGEPIDQAEIYIMMRSFNKGTFSGGGTAGPPETVTENDGYFELTKLRRDSKYILLVKAQGYGSKLISGFKAGDNLEVLLGEGLKIKGRVIGGLDNLLDRHGKYIVTYWNAYKFENHHDIDRNKKVEVQIENGVGYFEIEDIWGHKLDIRAGSKTLSIDPKSDALDDFVIDLRPEVISQSMREVILTFKLPEGHPQIEGGIRVDYMSEGDRKKHNSMTPEWPDINDGQVRIYVPVPGLFHYSIDHHNGKRPVGYWFGDGKTTDIKESNEPFLIEIPVWPAGAIYGRTLLADGSLAENSHASLIVSKKPSYFEWNHGCSA
jgi:beta-lactamase regulating signal transducer with metallopeptidase domain